MRFGLTFADWKRTLIVGVYIGLAGGIGALLVLRFLDGLTWQLSANRAVLIAFIPVVVMGVFTVPFFALSVHIVGDRVEMRLFDRLLIRSAKITDYVSRQLCPRIPPGVFYFKGNTTIRLSAPLGVITKLHQALEDQHQKVEQESQMATEEAV